MKQIRVLDNKGQEYLYPVEQPVAEVSIGRSKSNDIILSSKTVSRRHAIIKIMGDRILLVNQSANGVVVNGERIDRVQEMELGQFATIDIYRFCVEEQASARPPSRTPSRSNGRSQRRVERSSRLGGGSGRTNRSRATEAMPAASRSGAAGQMTAERSQPRARDNDSPLGGHADLDSYLGDIAPDEDYKEPRINLAGEEAQVFDRQKRRALVEFKAMLHDELKERLDLHSFEITDYRTPRTVRQVSERLKQLLEIHAHEIPPPFTRDDVFKELMDEVCGLGPIEDLIKHRKVSEIMVVDRDHIYAELDGNIVLTDRFFNDEKSMMTVIERIVIPRGRRIDESNPLVDTRLADGSRVNAVIPPLALKDPCLTIRKFPEDRLGVGDLVNFESLTPEMAKFLGRAVRARKNIIISGGTGSGKTTLLNVLSSFIGQTERVVTIEDAAELQLQQDHVVSLETKPPNVEGKGEVSIRDLVKNALRMRPDRIVVGECRGGEALDMLQAMNTGHEGSMTTVHSNSPREAIARLETLVLMSGMELPTRAIRQQIANSVDVIVQQSRFSDGSRRVSYITEVIGINDDGYVELEDIYRYKQTHVDENKKVHGYHMATGYLPSFLNQFLVQGLADEEDFF
ncbi:FHA domain-containing protein [Persicimonas caeni]|uniref:FHA domain-containing protein n=1 Tax=Persicimonas caeni TaxID=2292766 RepID=A0A4Y6PXX6_PERCE|nr:ATPase, T2SS/T4P/T4SS family [Persicimonas caeni]QDG53188.1 FHA domain-containing protein [Persicimonas caeni]QED34410.1 FHA domain-containing protein [Persicimonas caeni]